MFALLFYSKAVSKSLRQVTILSNNAWLGFSFLDIVFFFSIHFILRHTFACRFLCCRCLKKRCASPRFHISRLNWHSCILALRKPVFTAARPKEQKSVAFFPLFFFFRSDTLPPHPPIFIYLCRPLFVQHAAPHSFRFFSPFSLPLSFFVCIS